jgi:hypothetical protein
MRQAQPQRWLWKENRPLLVWIRFAYVLSDPALYAGLHLRGDEKTHAGEHCHPEIQLIKKQGNQIVYISFGRATYKCMMSVLLHVVNMINPVIKRT